MSLYRFHACRAEDLFEVIGSADRDALRDIGVTLGEEFIPPTAEEEDDYYDSEEAHESEDWGVEDEEVIAAREIIVQMITTGLPTDLSEDQSYAIQDYFARQVKRSEEAINLDIEDLRPHLDTEPDSSVNQRLRRYLAEGLEGDEILELIEWIEENEASDECLARFQLLFYGRLPESDEPTFSDLENDAYLPRFSYLTEQELGSLRDALEEIRESAEEACGSVVPLLAAAMDYCIEHQFDLLATIED